jgi:NADP-dependent 3-hydroxy acid dehydrogenase YdfG
MGLNLDAVYFLCKAAHPLLLMSDRPTIVNVASVAGRAGQRTLYSRNVYIFNGFLRNVCNGIPAFTRLLHRR